LTLYQANAATLTPLSKEYKILIKSQKLVNKGWTKNSINRLLLKFRTVDRRLGSGRRSAHTDENVGTVESMLLTQQDKPESQEKFHVRRRDPSIINFADYSQSSASQVLQEKARSTANRSAQHACVIFGMQFERR